MFVFSVDDSKIHNLVKIFHAPERSYWVLSENGIGNRFSSCHLWDIKGRNIRKTAQSAKEHPNPVCSRVHILLMAAQKPIMIAQYIAFSTRTKWDFSDTLKYFAQIATVFFFFFCCHQQKMQQMTHLWHFNEHKCGAKLLYISFNCR